MLECDCHLLVLPNDAIDTFSVVAVSCGVGGDGRGGDDGDDFATLFRIRLCR